MGNTAIVPAERNSLIATMANRYGLEPTKFLLTIQKTLFPDKGTVSMEQTAAFLAVANHYDLNPFIKEIYAFPRGGGIVPIVSVDGWATIINRQATLDGIEFEDHMDSEGKLYSITCRIHRKDRSRPTEVTEYMVECRRDTETWKRWPARMLRHKALIQAARYAFSLSGIYDPDEAERIAENGDTVLTYSEAARQATEEKTKQIAAKYAPPTVEEQPAEEQTTTEAKEEFSGIAAGD